MTPTTTKVATLVACFLSILSFGQDFEIPPISLNDFAEVETDAKALYLFNQGKTQIYYSTGQGWVARTTYHSRIRVLTKEGLDYADFDLSVFVGETDVESISDIEATTYNIDYESGTIGQVKMEKDAIFKIKESDRWRKVSFSLPQVRVNSVIDVRYVKSTPFIFSLDDWYFQHEVPVQHSHYHMIIPGFHQYVFGLNGYLQVDTSAVTVNNRIEQFGTYNYRNINAFWEMTDIPAFKEESFMTTREDYISKLEFQLQAIVTPDREDAYLKSWEEVSDDLKDNSRFKSFYRRKDKFEELQTLETDDLAKAKLLYEYFHSHFKWNRKFGALPDVNIAQFARNREGNTSALGLAMYNLMKQQGLDVKPVLFSPRFNGRINYDYPFRNKLICTVVKLEAEGETHLLDPVSGMPFGYLNKEFLSGKGLVLGEAVEWVDMSLNGHEKLQSAATIRVSKDHLQVEVSNQLMDYAVNKVDVEDLETILDTDWELDSILLREHEPDKLSFDYYLNQEVSDDLVLVPVMQDGLIMQENPFAAEYRRYPVDFYFKKRFTFQVTLDIEEGYEIESLPEPQVVRSPVLMTMLSVFQNPNEVKISVLHSVKTNAIGPEHYPALREAYNLLSDLKQSVIVLRKKT